MLIALVVGWRLVWPEHLSTTVGELSGDAQRLWARPYFHLGELAVSPAFLVKAVLFLVLLGVGARYGRRFIRRRILDYTPLNAGQKYALERGVGYVILLVGLLVALDSTGIDLSTLTVLGGAIGIGVGFGLQTIANNFMSGLILLLEHPIKVDDRIEVGNLNGDVTHIGARSTWIRTNDNVSIIVPNSEFITNRVTNWTASDRQVRFPIPLGVSYGSDPEKVRGVLLEVARANPDVLASPSPDVILTGFGDNSLDFELRVWTVKQVQTPMILRSDLYFAIFRAFRQHGIEIPFPQRDLHLRSVSAPFPVARQ